MKIIHEITTTEKLLRLLTQFGVKIKAGVNACTDMKGNIYLPMLREDATEDERLDFLNKGLHEGAHYNGKSGQYPQGIKQRITNAFDDVRVENTQEQMYGGIRRVRVPWYKKTLEMLHNQGLFQTTADGPIQKFVHALNCMAIFKARALQLGENFEIVASKDLQEAFDKYLSDIIPEIAATSDFSEVGPVVDKFYDRIKDFYKEKKEEEKKQQKQQQKAQAQPKPKQGGDNEEEQDNDTQPGEEDTSSDNTSSQDPDDDSDNESGNPSSDDSSDESKEGSVDDEKDDPDADGDGDDRTDDSDESKQSGSSESSDADDSDDEGSSSGSDSSSEASDDNAPKDSDDGDPSEESDASSDEADGAGTGGSTSDESEEDESSDSEEDDTEDLTDEEQEEIDDEINKLLDELDENAQEVQTLDDINTEAINDAASDYDSPYMKDPNVTDRIQYAQEGSMSIAEMIHQDGLDMLGMDGSRMTRFFTSHSHPTTLRGMDTGRFDMTTYARNRNSRGPSRRLVYSQKTPGSLDKAAVSIALDRSGSMNGPKMRIACSVCSALMYHLNKAGIPVEAAAYTDLGFGASNHQYRAYPVSIDILKTFEEPWSAKVLRRCVPIDSNGCTPDLDCLREFLIPRLSQRPEDKKIVFVISDGQPAAEDSGLTCKLQASYTEYIKLLRQHGMVVFGFGIQENVSSYFGEDSVYVQPNTLGVELVEKLRIILNRR